MEVLTREEAIRPLQASRAFLEYLAEWEAGLSEEPLAQVIRQAGGPQGVAVYIVDLLVGFCERGRLASPRVGAIVPTVTALARRAHDLGVRHFILPQDAHPQDSPEFEDYGPHCVVGTAEAEAVAELRELPFAGEFRVMPKRSVDPAAGTGLDAWLQEHPDVTTHIVTGDCTDICIYQLAMHLKTRANALGLDHCVVVPEDCVQTYDLPVEVARNIGATPHDGDLLHVMFLYHMRLNGVRVVRALM